MPHVLVSIPAGANTEPEMFARFALERFGTYLQRHVAEILSCADPGGKLQPSDIEIKFEPRNQPGCQYMGNEEYEIRIAITASYNKALASDLRNRNYKLREKVATFDWARGTSGYVWIKLVDAAFETFSTK